MSDLIPQRTDEVVLYQDGDQHEIDRLRAAIEKAAASSATPLRLGDDSDVVTAAEAYDAFVAEAADRGVKVGVRSIGRRWRKIAADHPPRKDNAEDEEWGWNVSTFCDAIVPLCVVSVRGENLEPAKVEEALDEMSDGDFSRVYAAAVKINTGRGPDPTVSISGTLRKTSPEISGSPERLG